ncbi:hypothetical protein F5984_19050 [Rudanella paleaurantiibacter]|uniref:Uncharacterized protein n=1 Tax=Rudanella paleaurantiibacter TaxID=2614655 RepID=A0A7J5TUQ1_9BACT|nr:hypothetical protein [Rudanella paleaurantiibacter]KAB7727869.1 hypothetical protein F5984_19050 [Rudanella paleaurantiibacter]
MNEKRYIRLDELDAGHPLRKHPIEATNLGVPDGYFDALPHQIQERVVTKQHGWSINWSWQRSVASLAGAGLVAALVWVTWPARQDSLGQESLADVSNTAITNYLDEQGVSSMDLADYTPIQQSFDSEAIETQLQDVNPEVIQEEIDLDVVAEDMANVNS